MQEKERRRARSNRQKPSPSSGHLTDSDLQTVVLIQDALLRRHKLAMPDPDITQRGDGAVGGTRIATQKVIHSPGSGTEGICKRNPQSE